MAKATPDKSDEAVDYELNTDSVSSKKGHATPTRKEREAANLRPLVSGDRKVSNQAARAKMAESRNRARIGMANGEEKFLPIRDKGAQRRFIRDHVDARYSVGELMIPVLVVIIIMTFISSNPAVQNLSFIVLWVFFLLAVADCIAVGVILNRKLSAKFGAEKLQKGNRWYAAMRALNLRALRTPKPQVKRRAYPS